MMRLNCHLATISIILTVCLTSIFTKNDYKEVLLAVSAGYYGLQNARE